MKKTNKQTKPLPSWITVTASDPKLKEAVENVIAEKITELAEKIEGEKQ